MFELSAGWHRKTWEELVGAHWLACGMDAMFSKETATPLQNASTCSDNLRHIKIVKGLFEQTPVPIGQFQTGSC